MSILGKRLRYLREQNNYSQKKVADDIGISNVQLSRYESGDRNPDPDLISKFASYYEVSTDYLLGITDSSKRPEHKEEEFKPLEELLKKLEELGAKDMGFYDIEKWKTMNKQELEYVFRHFEMVVEQAKKRQQQNKD